jgi:hypothetical protein
MVISIEYSTPSAAATRPPSAAQVFENIVQAQSPPRKITTSGVSTVQVRHEMFLHNHEAQLSLAAWNLVCQHRV